MQGRLGDDGGAAGVAGAVQAERAEDLLLQGGREVLAGDLLQRQPEDALFVAPELVPVLEVHPAGATAMAVTSTNCCASCPVLHSRWASS